MRTFTQTLTALVLIFGLNTPVFAAQTREPSGMQTCRIVTGYGTAIGRGKTLSAAREAARLTCGTNLIDQYFAQRQNVSDDVKDDLVLACVNLDCE